MRDEQVYSQYRPLLFSLAYRLLGSVVDAEDVVQETFLAWAERDDPEAVGSAKAYLLRIVSHKCTDWVRQQARRRERYVGPFLPEPFVEGTGLPEDVCLLRESLHTAYLLLLQQLGPVERTVFVLREAFGFSYAEIAEVAERSPAHCRQIYHRARGKMGAYSTARKAEPAEAADVAQLAEAFVQSVERGDMERVLELLTADAKLLTDGGGQVRAALAPIRTAEHVARFLVSITARFAPGLSVAMRQVNGLPGIVAAVGGSVTHVLSFAFEGGRIAGLYLVANPEKLTHLNRDGGEAGEAAAGAPSDETP